MTELCEAAACGTAGARGDRSTRYPSYVPRSTPQPDGLAAAARCGARTRAGAPCRSPSVGGEGRCRMHGGKGSGAPRGNRNAFKHGIRSARIRAIARYLRATRPAVTRDRLWAAMFAGVCDEKSANNPMQREIGVRHAGFAPVYGLAAVRDEARPSGSREPVIPDVIRDPASSSAVSPSGVDKKSGIPDQVRDDAARGDASRPPAPVHLASP